MTLNLPKGQGPALIREHMQSRAVGGVFTGRSQDIASATGVPWKSVEKIVHGMVAAQEIKRIRAGTLHHAAQYWVDAAPYVRPETVARVVVVKVVPTGPARRPGVSAGADGRAVASRG